MARSEADRGQRRITAEKAKGETLLEVQIRYRNGDRGQRHIVARGESLPISKRRETY